MERILENLKKAILKARQERESLWEEAYRDSGKAMHCNLEAVALLRQRIARLDGYLDGLQQGFNEAFLAKIVQMSELKQSTAQPLPSGTDGSEIEYNETKKRKTRKKETPA